MNAVTPDPIFAAIAAHKAAIKDHDRASDIHHAARKKAEKKHGIKWGVERTEEERKQLVARLDLTCADTKAAYDRWNRASDAEEAAAQRMAKTRPTTKAGAAAMIDHVRREIIGSSDIIDEAADWQMIALKTVASALREAA